MLHEIKQKLTGRSGVSLVLAMFLLLVCSFAGAAALTAAAANAGRFSKRAEYQQQYLAVASAARLITDSFDEASGKVTAKFTFAGDGNKPGESFSYESVENPPSTQFCSAIWEELKVSVRSVVYKQLKEKSDWKTAKFDDVTAPADKDLEMTVEGSEAFKPVKVTMHFNFGDVPMAIFTMSCGDYSLEVLERIKVTEDTTGGYSSTEKHYKVEFSHDAITAGEMDKKSGE